MVEVLDDVDVVDDDVVDEGDFDPDAGGELPHPATTSATATRAAPIQARVEPMSLLFILRPPNISVIAAANSMAVDEH